MFRGPWAKVIGLRVELLVGLTMSEIRADQPCPLAEPGVHDRVRTDEWLRIPTMRQRLRTQSSTPPVVRGQVEITSVSVSRKWDHGSRGSTELGAVGYPAVKRPRVAREHVATAAYDLTGDDALSCAYARFRIFCADNRCCLFGIAVAVRLLFDAFPGATRGPSSMAW